jgi:hypothetical protein
MQVGQSNSKDRILKRIVSVPSGSGVARNVAVA